MVLVRCVLEWQQDSEPVQGRLIGPDADEHPFTGWLEFLALADAMRHGESPEPEPRQAGE